jgi:hypothetical protein
MATKICKNGHKYKGDKCPHCPSGRTKRTGEIKTRIFGTTIRETIDAFKPVYSSDKSEKISKQEKYLVLIRTGASLALCIIAIFCLFNGKDEVSIGLGGTIIGYWLK